MNANTPLTTLARSLARPRDYVNAANRFAKFLERPATVADFNLETWQAFETWLPSQRWTPGANTLARHRLRILWAHAHEAGHAPELPPKRKGGNRTGPRPATFEGEHEPLPARSLAGFFERMYRPLKLRNGSPRTVKLYAYTCRNLSIYLGRHATLDDLTEGTITGLLVWMADRGLAPHSRQKEIWQLAAIGRFAVEKRLIDEYPDITPEKLPERTPDSYLLDELPKLWNGIRAAGGSIAGIPAADWWDALIRTFLATAERVSAVMACKWSDYDPATGWLNIRAEYRKGNRKDNAVRLNPAAMAALAKIREPERELLFPIDFSPTYLWRKYGNLLKAAGLPDDARSKFHKLRRTVASHYEAAGGNATALLTHSNRKVTERYLDPRIVKPVQAADLLGDMLDDVG